MNWAVILSSAPTPNASARRPREGNVRAQDRRRELPWGGWRR